MNRMYIEPRSTNVDAMTYRARRPDGAGGRIARSCDTEHDAETFATGLHLRRQGAEIDRIQITLDDYIAQIWVPVYGPQLAQSPRATYRYIYARYVRPRLGTRPLAEITPDLTAGWQRGWLQSGTDQRSVRRGLLGSSGILQTAVRAHYLAVNPVGNVPAAGSAG
jgi:hypothetical protein